MPTQLVQAIARRQGKPVSEVEKKWEEAKRRAAEEGHAKDWKYVMAIFQRMTHSK